MNADPLDQQHVQSPISRIDETINQTPFTNNQTPNGEMDSEVFSYVLYSSKSIITFNYIILHFNLLFKIAFNI